MPFRVFTSFRWLHHIMKEEMMKKIQSGCRVLLAIMMMALLWGCATPAIYSVNMSYDATDAMVPTYMKPDQKALQSIIAVAEFVDLRQVDDPLVIGRVIEKDGLKVLVLPKRNRPVKSASEGVRQYLRKAGYNVSAVVDPWNLSEATIPNISNSRILIGGAIEDMEVTCRRAFPTNTYTTKIKLTICVADMNSKRILHKASVVATTSLEHMLFSEDRLGEQAGYAMGDAIEKLFEKREVSQAIRQALGQ